jgi:putative addiction module component (TIGR02574 family)
MGVARTIDKQINQYLGKLNTKQKQAVLTVVKTFAEEENEMMEAPGEYTPAFKAELDKRYADYKSGKSKTVTPAESKKRIQKIMKPGKGK